MTKSLTENYQVLILLVVVGLFGTACGSDDASSASAAYCKDSSIPCQVSTDLN